MAGAKNSGVWDLLTYYAGVSGSCWGIASYYTVGQCNHDRLINHLRTNLTLHPASNESIQRVLSVPDGAHLLLGGIEQKHLTGTAISLWDFYGALVAGSLFLGQGPDARFDPSYFKLTNQQKALENGQEVSVILRRFSTKENAVGKSPRLLLSISPPFFFS